jgi:hypothetical protein
MTRTNRDLICIAEKMRDSNYKNSFAHTIALAMLIADDDNRQRLANAFPELMVRSIRRRVDERTANHK